MFPLFLCAFSRRNIAAYLLLYSPFPAKPLLASLPASTYLQGRALSLSPSVTIDALAFHPYPDRLVV